jgi:glycosyltransferase involved in cell wall biosynthesis
LARLLGLRGIHQLYFVGDQKPGSTLIIGPGMMPVPPVGWGAVETIIDEMSTQLATSRPTMVLNSFSLLSWFGAFRIRHEVIHVHSDKALVRASRWRFLNNRSTPIVVWHHFPYLAQPEFWHPGFQSRWTRMKRHLRSSDVFIALSPSIADVVGPQLPATILTLPNASSFSPRIDLTPSRDLLVLGKVTPRKQQFELSGLVLWGTDITFVGPINDQRVIESVATEPRAARSKAFVGEWSRADLAEKMSSFKVLLLPSKAEADALVLYEAQLAGLSIICSRHALGAQDAELPWIYTHETDASLEQLQLLCSLAIQENVQHRPRILEYAQANFLWSDRIEQLDECLQRS